MKYLYKILRMFFCPHKYKHTDTFNIETKDKRVIEKVVEKSCKYCGKNEYYRIKT